MKCVCQKQNNLVKMKRFLTHGKSLFSITDNGKSLFSITDNQKSFSITDNHYSYLMQCFIVNFFVFVRNKKRFVRNEKRFVRNEMSLSEMKCVKIRQSLLIPRAVFHCQFLCLLMGFLLDCNQNDWSLHFSLNLIQHQLNDCDLTFAQT